MSDEEHVERPVYLTRRQVVEGYGFDPFPYDERGASGERFIRNKLTPGGVRLWLEADVIAHPDAHPRSR